MKRGVAVGLLVVAATGCGGGPRRASGHDDLSQLDCDGRRIEYMVAGGFVAAEAGIRLECDAQGPRLTSWRLEASGERTAKTAPLNVAQFEATWEKIESTGWRFLPPTCPDGSGVDGDPIYSIDVADSAKAVSLSCQGKELPFPYDRLVNELDLRAAGFGDGAGPAR